MAMVRVRVGAAADPSLRTVFRPLEEAAARAEQTVNRTARRGQQAQTRAAADGAKAAKAGADAITAIERQQARRVEQEQRNATKAAQREFDQRLKLAEKAKTEKDRLAREETKAAERATKAHEREEKKKEAATKRRLEREAADNARNRRHLGHDIGGRTLSNLGRAASFASNTGRDVMRGLGADVGVSQALSRGVELEQLAVAISNSGINTHQGKQRVSPSEIVQSIKATSDQYAFSREDTGQGLAGFVGKTGELQLGLNVLGDMGRIAKATGASIEDMANAAADVNNALGDTPTTAKGLEDRAQKIGAIMRAFALQGKLGAVEIKNLATHMAKIGASSGAFEGDAGQNLVTLGGLVQLARSKGGASSAVQAAQAIASMTNTLKTPARIKAFEKAGVDVFNKEGEIRDPRQLIMESLVATAGKEPTEFKKMWMNVLGARAPEALKQTFDTARQGTKGTEAQKTAAGIKAVEAELKKYTDAFNDPKANQANLADEASSLELALNTTAAKAQRVQNTFDDIAAAAMQKLVPALEKLLPQMEKLATAFAEAVTWAAENPGKAITAAIVGSIGKAAIEGTISNAIAQFVMKGGSNAAGAGGGGLLGGMGFLGNAGAALAITAAAVTITAAGVTLIDQAFKAKEAADEAARQGNIDSATARANLIAGGASPEALKKLQEQAAQLRNQLVLADAGEARKGVFGGPDVASQFKAGLNFVSAGHLFDQDSDDRQSLELTAAKNRAATQEELAKTSAAILAMTQKLGGTLNVNVLNMPGGGGVDQGGRVGFGSLFVPFALGGGNN